MAQTVPAQHPAVVLRSHYRQLRALLAIAMVAVVGLTIAVVILATDGRAGEARSAAPVSAPTDAAGGPRYIHSPGQRYAPAHGAAVPAQAGSRSSLVAPPSPRERDQKRGLDGPGMRR